MIPLLRLTGSRAVMGASADRLWVRILGGVVAGLVVLLNLALVGLTIAGA
jgi:manganese transport protein